MKTRIEEIRTCPRCGCEGHIGSHGGHRVEGVDCMRVQLDRMAELVNELRANQIKGRCRECQFSSDGGRDCREWDDGNEYPRSHTIPLGYCHKWEAIG
jgi:hypothetical protein